MIPPPRDSSRTIYTNVFLSEEISFFWVFNRLENRLFGSLLGRSELSICGRPKEEINLRPTHTGDLLPR